MFRSNFATYPYVSPDNTYGQNLSRAARAFVAALLAMEPAERKNSAQAQTSIEDARVADTDEIAKLAKHFDSFMPNQAAELWYLAGSDTYPENEISYQ